MPTDLCFDAAIEVIEQLGSEIVLDMKVGDGMMVASVEPSEQSEGARQAAPRDAAVAAARVRRQDRRGDLTFRRNGAYAALSD